MPKFRTLRKKGLGPRIAAKIASDRKTKKRRRKSK